MNAFFRRMLPLFALLLAVVIAVSTAPAISADEADKTDKKPLYTDADAQYIARTIWGEARGCPKMEQAAVAWCILNRVDNENPYFPDTIAGVVKQPSQFAGYCGSNPVDDDMLELANDVLARWEQEKNGETDVGRVLPERFLFFGGNGRHNFFRSQLGWKDTWDWSCDNPYEECECAQ